MDKYATSLVTDFHFCPPKKVFVLRMPDFYQTIKLNSLLIKYFQFGMVLIEHFWIIQRYIIGEDISTKSRASWEEFFEIYIFKKKFHEIFFERILDKMSWNASQSSTQAFLGSLSYIGYNKGQICSWLTILSEKTKVAWPTVLNFVMEKGWF